MEAFDPIYEEGCAAGKIGCRAEQNPYPKSEKTPGVYSLSDHDRWELGRRRGAQWCPYCNGTGRRSVEDVGGANE